MKPNHKQAANRPSTSYKERLVQYTTLFVQADAQIASQVRETQMEMAAHAAESKAKFSAGGQSKADSGAASSALSRKTVYSDKKKTQTVT